MILSLFVGFISGLALGSFFVINKWIILAFVFLGIITFLYKYFIDESNRKIILVVSFLFVGIFLGSGRMLVSDLYKTSELDMFAKQKIRAEGVVVNEPDVRETNTKLTVEVSQVFIANNDSEKVFQVKEKVLVSVPIHPEFLYGDKVSMDMTLEEPSEIENDGRVFDYKGYLRVREIWYTSRFTTISLLSRDHGNIIKKYLYKTKNAFTSSIQAVLPEPESSLLGGLLLGSKQSLGKDLLQEFQKTGVSHIVVLSGYNIAIVANSIIEFFKFLPKNFSFGFGAIGIFLFAVLSGGGASVWRASIMVLVALFAKQTNRDYKVARIFAFTVVIMLAPNPLLLIFDPSFQLSVLATIGLIFVSPLISPYLTRVTERFGLREIISATIATQITVLPYLIYNMGLISFVSLPVNILVLVTIPITMFLGFVTGLVGLVSFYLSFIPAFFTYILLWYQLKVVHIGSLIPFGSVMLPGFSPIILILIYIIIFISIFYLKNKKL
jgi:competence protein ComEC